MTGVLQATCLAERLQIMDWRSSGRTRLTAKAEGALASPFLACVLTSVP